MNDFEEELRSFMNDSLKFQGKVLEHMENAKGHTASVSRKIDEVRDDLHDHVRDDNAHGAGTGNRHLGVVLGIGSLLVAVAALLMRSR